MTKPVALFASDIHLSHNAPVLRSEEPDWYEAMRRPLRELRDLARKLKVPVVYPGDIFDHWKNLPELVNFAIQELPKGYAIPGQHDLINHSYEEIERTSYWTLVEAGLLKHLEPGAATDIGNDVMVYGWPWRHPVQPLENPNPHYLNVAVVHAYIWFGRYKYHTASEDCHAKNHKLKGYDASFFGDNHINWIKNNICNCGGFYRRHSPDLDRQPSIGVLMSDGSIKQHLLDTSDDIYVRNLKEEAPITVSAELTELTEGLLGLRSSEDLDFGQVLRRYCKTNKVPSPVVSHIDSALDEERVS